MVRVVYIGDEVTAAGFRLAGVETRVVEPDETVEALQHAVAERAELILLSGALTAHIPPEQLAALEVATSPIVAVVADVSGRNGAPDLARDVRNTLGIEA